MKGLVYFKNKKGIDIFTCFSGRLKHLNNESSNILKINTESNRLEGKFSLDSVYICFLQYKLLI